jgi:leucyl aminopeptidase (aminopeptidase T)
MDRMQTMTAAALDAMIHVLDLEPSDRVLVVTDPETAACGEAFALAAADHGCPVSRYHLPAEGRPLQAMPADMPALLDETTVVVNAIVGDAGEVPFRLEWIHAIEARGGIRLGHSPGIDEDMMVAGPLNVDYAAMGAGAERLLAGLAGAEALRVTTPAGTDLRLDVTDRRFVSDLKATVDMGANLPCGEVYCAPVETGADGIVVIDGCFGSHGSLTAPVVITVAGGQVVDIAGDDDAVVGVITGLMDTDHGSRTIAELGIGLNPGARLTPRMLEAEKAHHTAHVAFGDNEGMPGGRSRSKMHMDYLVLKPTIEAFFADGSSQMVMEDGAPA